MSLDAYLNLINLAAVLYLVYLIRKSSQSLIGSFFKQYYQLLLIGVAALFFGFVFDIVYSQYLNWMIVIKVIRHVLFVTFGFLFVYAANVLPKEASEYMESKDINRSASAEPKRL